MRLMVFFFKQKTAYEMRISDWSSDVCSSDLIRLNERSLFRQSGELKPCLIAAYYIDKLTKGDPIYIIEPITHILEREARVHVFDDVHHRSEEHTSELQSLMRISYAVFCLQKTQNLRRFHHQYKSRTDST